MTPTDGLALATTCAALKDTRPALLPAWQRYRSPRIAHLQQLAHARHLPFLILSGKLGLISAEESIPHYDHLLQLEEVPAMLPQVVAQLGAIGLAQLEFHHRPLEHDPLLAPYLDLLDQACAQAGVELVRVELLELPGRD